MFVWIISLCSFVYAQEGDIKIIDDEEKSSSKYSDMYSDFETVSNAAEAVKTGVGTAKTGVKWGKEIKAGEFNPIKKLKGSLKGMVFKYKSAKMGPLSLLKDISKKISKALSKVDKRINMWRTTLPTLKAYAKTSKLLVDNTVQVFKEFKIKDLWDIDRKWNRKMESSVLANYRCFYSFGKWMSQRYYQVNKADIIKNNMKKYDVLIYPDDEVQKGVCYNETVLASNLYVLHNMHAFNNLPKTSLMNAAEVLHFNERILARSYDYNDEGITFEQAMFDTISGYMAMDGKTMVDDQNLAAFIALKRAEVEIQRTELEQIQTNITVQYSRLLLRAKEKQALTDDKHNNDLKKLIGNEKLKSYIEHREDVFGDISG